MRTATFASAVTFDYYSAAWLMFAAGVAATVTAASECCWPYRSQRYLHSVSGSTVDAVASVRRSSAFHLCLPYRIHLENEDKWNGLTRFTFRCDNWYLLSTETQWFNSSFITYKDVVLMVWLFVLQYGVDHELTWQMYVTAIIQLNFFIVKYRTTNIRIVQNLLFVTMD